MQGKVEKIIPVSMGNDFGEIMDLWLKSNMEAHSFISKNYWISHFEEVKAMLPQAELFVWREKGKILGFLGLMGDYIAGFFVDGNHRSQRIGKNLLDDVKRNRKVLSLHVYEKNEAALRFYKREGFLVCEGQVDEETGEKEYLMKWTREEEK